MSGHKGDSSCPLSPHTCTLIIGYGNPLRADDGVGWQVTQRLASDVHADVVVISTHQLTPELAEPISRARLVVFVDAHIVGEPGSVDWQIVAPTAGESATFSHDVDPQALLELTRLVYGACPTAIVVSIAGADFGYGVGLSRKVQAAIPEAVRRVRVLLADGVDTPRPLNVPGSAGGRTSCTS